MRERQHIKDLKIGSFFFSFWLQFIKLKAMGVEEMLLPLDLVKWPNGLRGFKPIFLSALKKCQNETLPIWPLQVQDFFIPL